MADWALAREKIFISFMSRLLPDIIVILIGGHRRIRNLKYAKLS